MNENSLLEAEVRSLQRKLMKRDGQILKQGRELHKLRVSGVMSTGANLKCGSMVFVELSKCYDKEIGLKQEFYISWLLFILIVNGVMTIIQWLNVI